MPSKRSRKPPWPGSMAPESLIFARRFNQDSKRSPSNDVQHMIKLKNNIKQIDFISLSSHKANQSPMSAKRYPPQNPSHVLPGLTMEAMACLPIRLPIMYDPVS